MPESVHYPKFKAALPSMKGKTVAITGTTSGTGYVAARTVGELGARVLLLNRPSSRADASLQKLREGVPEAEFVPIECDLQSFASVRAACDVIRGIATDGLDVLCNNAGVMALADQATEDGFDVQMQTNHLSHFLLTAELFPLMKQAAQVRGEARVVNHSSMARKNPKRTLHGEYLEKRGGSLGGDGASMLFAGARWVRYGQSKLANCAFTAALHLRLLKKSSRVKALVAHPGFASTELQNTSVKEGGMSSIMTPMLMGLSQSTEDGALGILSCMCLTHVRSGQFYGPGSGIIAFKGPAEPFGLESFYDNEQTRELLWSKSEAAVGREFVI